MQEPTKRVGQKKRRGQPARMMMDVTRGEAVITAVASGQDMSSSSSSIWTGDPSRAGAVLCRPRAHHADRRTDRQTDRSMRQAALPCFRCVHCLRCAAAPAGGQRRRFVTVLLCLCTHAFCSNILFWVLLALPCCLRG